MKRHLRIAFAAWAGLLLLLAVQLGLALLPNGAWHLPVALAVAGAMAVLVGYVFMELASAPKLATIFAYAGVGWMLILFCLGGADYVTRTMTFVAEPIQRVVP